MLKWYLFELPPGTTRHHYYFQQCLPYMEPNLVIEFALNSVIDYLRLYQPRVLNLQHFHMHKEHHHLAAQVKYEADQMAYEACTGIDDPSLTSDFETGIYELVTPLFEAMRSLFIQPVFNLQHDALMVEPANHVDSYIGWLNDNTFVIILASVPIQEPLRFPTHMELMHMGVWT